MIDSILAIIDRLISLKEYRNKRLNKLFDDLFEPVFEELLVIHRDYLIMFEETSQLLPLDENLNLKAPGSREFNQRMHKAAEYLGKRRIEFEPVRDKLRALAKSMKSTDLPAEERAFVESVYLYFPSIDSIVRKSASRELQETIRYHSNEKQADNPEDYWLPNHTHEIQAGIENLLDELKYKWSDVCEAYVRLKIAAANRP